MRVYTYEPKSSNAPIVYPKGYDKNWFLTNPWYIPISDPKQVKPTIDFIIKYLGAERNHIDASEYKYVKRLSIFSIRGERHHAVLKGTSQIPEDGDVRQFLEVCFDEQGKPALSLGYIGPKLDFADTRNPEILKSIHRLEESINQSEEIILKLIEKRKQLIETFEGK